MKRRTQSAIKGALYYSVLQFVLRGMSFLAVMYFSRALTKQEYGAVSNFQAWAQLLFPFVTLDFRDAVTKACYKYEDDIDSYLSSCFLIGHIIILLLFAINEIFHGFLSTIFSLDMIYVRILAAYLCCNFVYDIVRIKVGVLRNYKLDAVYMFVGQGGQILLSVVLVYFMSDKELGRIIGITLPVVLMGTYLSWGVKKRTKKVRGEYIKHALAISAPMLFACASNSILSSSDRAMITTMCGEEEAAMYQIGYTVSTVVSMVWTAFNSAYGPWIYDNLSKNNFEYVKKMTRKYTFFYYSLVLCVMVLSPEILFIMGGEKYIDAVDVLPPVMLGLVFNYLYTFSFCVEYFYGETYIISVGTILSAIINVVLNFLLIPRFGYIAAAYTTMIGYIFLAVFHHIIVKFKVKKSDIFDNAFFMTTTIILIGIQCISVLFTGVLLIRIGILIVIVLAMGIFGYKNKEILMGALRK